MSREKQGYRDTIASLNEMFPGQGMLNKSEAAQFLGVSPRTIQRWIKAGKLNMNTQTGRIPKADLARQVCI